MRQEVIVSLEGARIVVDEGICQQGEYVFAGTPGIFRNANLGHCPEQAHQRMEPVDGFQH
jgi:hypothetical protein